MNNLLNETLEVMNEHNLLVKDIVFIGSLESNLKCSFEEFQELADITYDNGYGSQEILSSLTVVFKDGSRLIRDEYDGSESWKFLLPLVEDLPFKQLTCIKEI